MPTFSARPVQFLIAEPRAGLWARPPFFARAAAHLFATAVRSADTLSGRRPAAARETLMSCTKTLAGLGTAVLAAVAWPLSGATIEAHSEATAANICSPPTLVTRDAPRTDNLQKRRAYPSGDRPVGPS